MKNVMLIYKSFSLLFVLKNGRDVICTPSSIRTLNILQKSQNGDAVVEQLYLYPANPETSKL